METSLQFGPFRLIPHSRLLMEGERVLRVGSRAFDLLVVLVERAGTVVSNAEIMSLVWRDAVVEPGSLRMHIAALRKALGDGAQARYIVNVPLRGYTFAAHVIRTHEVRPVEPLPPAPALDAPARADTLPSMLTRLVGRDDVLQDLIRRIPRNRCVTLVGAGGIGKTTVSLAAAHEMRATYREGAYFVELGALEDGRRVPAALASALGVAVLPGEPIQGLCAFLRDKQMLIVLDNCEQVVGHVASMVEQVLAAAPSVNLLVTSREPLRMPGEWVQRLPALETPAVWRHLTPAQALSYPAVRLFVERAAASADNFVLGPAELPLVCSLCQRLDGLPLAIEIAAASIDRLGLKGLSDTLGSQLSTLMRGRRTALPRHRTLRATLDWSHALLEPTERILFRRLSVFAGAFSYDAAQSVCTIAPGEEAELRDLAADLTSLVGKSLVTADISGPSVLYRLLEMSREYAREQLARSNEMPTMRGRHAEYVLQVFTEAEATRSTELQSQWQAKYARSLGDLRSALAFSFSEGGSPALGLSLAAVSAPVWFDFSLMAEYRELAEHVLALLPGMPQSAESAETMKILEAYGHALWHTRGGGPAMAAAFSRSLKIAERLGSAVYQQRATWGLWLIFNTTGDSAGSVRMAEQFGRITGPGTDDSGPTHDRMMALALHFHGEQARARHHALRVLDHQSRVNRIAQNSGFQFDQRVAALTVLARTLWIHGYPDQALRHGEMAVSEAVAVGHALSLCYGLANGAIPAAFWAGDVGAATRYTRLLLERSTEHSLIFWQAFAEGYELILGQWSGADDPGPHYALTALKNPATSPLLKDTLCTIDARLFDGQMQERVGKSGWCAPELMRLQGEWFQVTGEPDAAEHMFVEALTLAQHQQALSWELRCAESLARLEMHRGCGTRWRAQLEGVYRRFTEGRETRDLRRIGDLLTS